MAGIKNSVMVAKNADYSQAAGPNSGSSENNGLVNDGRLWIGSAALNVGGTHINVGTLTSPLGTLSIGYSSPNITLDLIGGATAVEKIALQTGTTPIVPSAGTITFNGAVVAAGTNPVRTDGTGASTMALEVQISQALAAADATKIGLSNFSSAGFGVAATGFVTLAASVPQLFTANTGTATPSSNNLNVLGGGGVQTTGSGATLTIAVSGGGFTWTDVTSATQSIAVQNGYLTDHSATVVYTLPATASIGDTFIVVGKLGLTVITPNANQQLLMSSASGTVGATGTASGTNVGDSITFVCITSGASTIWRASSWVGNWTLA